MNLEDQIKDALIAELQRQADEGGLSLQVGKDGEGGELQGRVDLRSLAMAVVGAVSGGP